METARKLRTHDDLLARPEDARAEIHAGTVVTQPSGLPEHGRLVGGLSDDDLDGRDGGSIMPRPRT